MNWSGLQAFSQHSVLSSLFLEHVIAIVNQTPLLKVDTSKGESTTTHPVDVHGVEDVLQAAVIALTAFFRSIFNYISLSCCHILYFIIFFLLHFNAEVVARLEKEPLSKVMLLFLLPFCSTLEPVMG